jgi:ATP-dependent Clp protease ATP-binding subunit ClpA
VNVTLDHGGHWLAPLFYPEVSALGRKVDRLLTEIERGVSWVITHENAAALYRRRAAGAPQVRQVRIELEAPHKAQTWSQSVELDFHVITWTHGETALLAYVPTLDIEVLAESEEHLQKLLPNHIRFALMRSKATTSLRSLLWLQRAADVSVQTQTVAADVATPRERAVEEDDEKPSTLREVTSDLAKMAQGAVFERDALIHQVVVTLTGRRPRSVLLVGASGVGKTAIVIEMARRRVAFNLASRPLRATSGARLVSGMTGYGMWQERCRRLCQEAVKQKAIIHFGNLVELMEVGKHEGNQQGVASFLRPYFERGDVLAICECTPEQLSHIERRQPNLLNALIQINVDEPTAEQTKSILQQYAMQRTSGHSPLSPEALDAIDGLHRRYATYSANPGRPLRFLHNLLEDRRPRVLQTSSDKPSGVHGEPTKPAATAHHQEISPLDTTAVTAAFSAETGLPLDILDESRPLDLGRTRDWFAARVLGQDEAVDLIVDLLAAIKANLTRPHRPVASLLFIGPTGVGKTEMAKALAEFLYHDAQRMTRIDMSEYADPLAADRLIGGSFQEEGLLTARVREQPFGVVLLDEFEKAHPRLFDLLLQVLGEGRLTDAAGRLADFSNSVVIMTSNLGAAEHKRSSLGFGDATMAADRVRSHYLRAVRHFLRPELFNRIDRIVPFNSLSEELINQIARRELDLLEKRDGVRYRDLHLDLNQPLAAHLTEKGYDPRYGARPLKRAMERELLAPLADALNQFAQETPLATEIELAPKGLRVRAFGRMTEESDEEHPLGLNHPRLATIARRCVDLRREAFRLQQSHAVLDIENTLFRLEQLEKRAAKGKYVPPAELERLRRLPVLRNLLARVRQMAFDTAALEESILAPCYARQEVNLLEKTQEAAQHEDNLAALIFDLYALNFGDSNLVTLVVYSEQPAWLNQLAWGYYRASVAQNFQARLFALRALNESIYQRLADGEANPLPPGEFLVGVTADTNLKKLKTSNDTVLRAIAVEQPLGFLNSPQEGVVGVALRVAGPLAFALWEPENGLHLFREENERHACLVHTVGQDFGATFEYRPPHRIDRRGAISKQPVRRQIDFDRHEIDDRHLDIKTRLASRNLEESLATLAQRRLVAEARKWLGL